MTRPVNLSIFVTHPVQYHVPLWRGLSAKPDLRVKVFYFSDHGAVERVDPGFGKSFAWDLPLLEGYAHEFISRVPIGRTDQASIPDAAELVSREKPDVVMIHGYTQRYARELIGVKRRHPFRLLLRGEFSDMPRRRGVLKRLARALYLRWFYRQVDHFCPIGMEAKSHLARRGVAEERITVTPYCVDDRYFERQRILLDRQECRRKLGLLPDQQVFLFSGKMIPRKQPLLLAEAVRACAGNPRLALMMIGDGQLFATVERLLRPSLGARLIMPGFVNQSEIGAYYRAADVLVLPSQAETWGLVVNEAMHFGLPAVVSDRVGCRWDLIREGETGYVFPFDQPAALTERLARFLQDPSLAARMGERAHERIQGYTVSRTVEALYQAVGCACGREKDAHETA